MSTTYKFVSTTYETDEWGVDTTIEHTFTIEDDLNTVLYHFKSFLQGAGYNYIKNVYAVKDNGEEVGEE